jgi:hypothetical protein
MSQLTISLPEALDMELERRMREAGFQTKEDYLLELVRTDCENAELESQLEGRIEGPFAPLEDDWQERVRVAAKRRG